MKKATLITLLAVAIGQGVFGQSKPKVELFGVSTYDALNGKPIETLNNTNISKLNSTATSAFTAGRLQGFSKLEPLYYSFTGGINGKEMLRIKIPNNTIPFDSLIIYVKKSQLRWINDSTAVIKK